jgi:hypothetical protein
VVRRRPRRGRARQPSRRRPTFDAVLTEQPRPDVPTFTVPDGYAEQGINCWITNETERPPAGIMRSLVAQCTTIEELEARAKTALDQT